MAACPTLWHLDLGTKMKIHCSTSTRSSGFSLIEVMISMVVLAIGLLSVLAMLGVTMAATQTSQEDMIARQVASETMESIFNARNTSQIGFYAINSTTATPTPGIFLPTANMPLLCAGPDGILDTADDAACTITSGLNVGTSPCAGGVEFLTNPGPDGVLGTADDSYQCLNNFTRTIQINELSQTLAQVVITISYTVPNVGHTRTYVLEEYISSYS